MLRTVDIWGIFWIFVLMAIFYAVIYYDVIWEKIKRTVKGTKQDDE